jgi:uncharacterized membrane protein
MAGIDKPLWKIMFLSIIIISILSLISSQIGFELKGSDDKHDLNPDENDLNNPAPGIIDFYQTRSSRENATLSTVFSQIVLDPGDKEGFEILLKNTDNITDMYHLYYNIEKSKENILPEVEVCFSINDITLIPDDFTYIYINLTVGDSDYYENPKDVHAGDYRLILSAASVETNMKYHLFVNFTITEKYRIELTADDPRPSNDPLEVSADDPDGISFFVTAKNKGNADDSLTLGALDNSPDGWIFNFRVDDAPTKTVRLAPGESQRVKVQITFDEDIESSLDYAGVTVKSSKNNAKYGLKISERIYIDVQIYLLKIL